MDVAERPRGVRQVVEVFWVALRLGLTSFGGPIAHLGYFREEYVVRRRWLDEATYARLLALTQFLPGPASSQLGFAIGRHRGGLAGGVAAFLGFTLPSFLIMVMVALYATRLPEAWLNGLVTGLKWLAVVVVAMSSPEPTIEPAMMRPGPRWLMTPRIVVGGSRIPTCSVVSLPGAFGSSGAASAPWLSLLISNSSGLADFEPVR